MKLKIQIISSVSFFFLVSCGFAATLGYDPLKGEQPDQIDPAWKMGPYNPINGFYGDGTIAAINSNGSDAAYWYYDKAGLTNKGYTIDFRALVDNDSSDGYYPIQILLYDSGELVTIELGKQEGIVVKQEGAGVRASDRSIDTTTYHTYRYVRSGQHFSVYIDDKSSPLFVGSLKDNNVAPGYDRVLFGRGGSDARGTGAIDYLRWDNSQAIETPPVAPKVPETQSLGMVIPAVLTRIINFSNILADNAIMHVVNIAGLTGWTSVSVF